MAALRPAAFLTNLLIPRNERFTGRGSILDRIHAMLQPSFNASWLLIFDDAESTAMLRQFWPACTQGAIIVTSQDPALSIMIKESIHLSPLSLEEGSSLIQKILQRGALEKEEAQELSDLLGGLPLAITHFAGAILRSQCPISQISHSFVERAQSSRVWAVDDSGSVSRGYEHTLNTVWDVSIQRLSQESTRLLELIAFIEPDRIPVDMFIKESPIQPSNATQNSMYWDIGRFNEVIKEASSSPILQYPATLSSQQSYTTPPSMVFTVWARSTDMLIHVLSTMGPINAVFGSEGRAKSVGLVTRVIHLLEERTKHIPHEKLDKEQCFLFGRAYEDYTYYLLQTSEIEEAARQNEKSDYFYTLGGNRESLEIPSCERILLVSLRSPRHTAREMLAKAEVDSVKHCGERDAVGLLLRAAGRSEIFGSTHYPTLSSQYCLAVCQQNKPDLESAETALREILPLGRVNEGWRPEDITRVKFRLPIVLAAQNRFGEAAKFRAEVEPALSRLRPEGVATDEDDIGLLDREVSLNHGRTSKAWSKGSFW
ncbi:hypothetical protein DL98DRAFT_643137 [Cadophora sp. DSE1049]|nr:hypothetical protein DL98DRAFT_643137 [Cadophora sp. DSE1049]